MTKTENETSACFYFSHLKPQCERCFGLCCTALCFSAQDGFPVDKTAGTPCPNLAENFCCAIHGQLGTKGYKGCVAYECFGAGQQISQVTFKGKSWRQEPQSADLMFAVFFAMQQLHEVCWYLSEACTFHLSDTLLQETEKMLMAIERITGLDASAILKTDLSALHKEAGALLKKVSKHMRIDIGRANRIPFQAEKENRMPADYFAKDLRKKDLRCKDLRGACLIAANLEGADLTGTNFIGADFRDTNIKGANLSKSIFLSQSQINAAKGNAQTKLPPQISLPSHWK